MNTILKTLFLLMLAINLTGCRPVWQGSLPDGEILYYRDGYPSDFLGFVQANGDNNQLLEFKRKFFHPVWSSDDHLIYGLSGGKGASWGFPAYWNHEKGKFKICTRNLPMFAQIQGAGNPENLYEVFLHHATEIISYDISRCRHIDTLVDYSDRRVQFNEIAGFSYSPSRHSLVYGLRRSVRKKATYPLMYLDLNTGETTQIAEGVHPSWSPDGSQIAYFGLDGLYLLSIEGIGEEPRQLVAQPFFDPADNSGLWLSGATWSPDGQWLAYHRCDDGIRYCKWKDAVIYKVPSQGGEEEIILAGGEAPSWRP
jgi:hypothetical protein